MFVNSYSQPSIDWSPWRNICAEKDFLVNFYDFLDRYGVFAEHSKTLHLQFPVILKKGS